MFALLCNLIIFSFSAAYAGDPETLVFSFQKQKNPEELRASTQAVSHYLEQKLGKKVEVLVPTSYGTTVQGLINNKVHTAYMDSLPFILASAEAQLEVLAVEKRNGKTSYDSLIVVGKDSPIKNLKDLKGRTIAFSSQTSTSGYLFPFYKLSQTEGLSSTDSLNSYFSNIVYAGGYDKALLAVSSGQTDVAAFSDYAFEGPKADLYGSKEIRNKVKILTRISGVPTHLIAGSKSLSTDLLKKIQRALLDLSKEQPQLLSSVYGAADLTLPKGNHVEATQSALRSTGLEPKSFVK
jgi:phosphonate transport system substrate-binding protein